MARQTGKRPSALDGPECPAELAYLLTWFREAGIGRPNYGFGPSRIQALHFAQTIELLHRITPEPWEIRTLMKLDNLWIWAMTKKADG